MTGRSGTRAKVPRATDEATRRSERRGEDDDCNGPLQLGAATAVVIVEHVQFGSPHVAHLQRVYNDWPRALPVQEVARARVTESRWQVAPSFPAIAVEGQSGHASAQLCRKDKVKEAFVPCERGIAENSWRAACVCPRNSGRVAPWYKYEGITCR